MKKVLKISGIILGVLLVLALGTYIACPGLITYFRVKKDCPNIDDTIGTFSGFNVQAPSDWVPVTVDGVTVRGPEDALYDSDLIPFKKEGEFKVMVIVSEKTSDGFYDEVLKYSEEDYAHFLKKFGGELIMDEYEQVKFLYKLTAKDCLRLRGKDLKIFRDMAVTKDVIANIETLSYCEYDGLKGFLSDYGEGKSIKYQYALWLFGKEHEYVIRVHSNDEETVYQCLSTVKIEEE